MNSQYQSRICYKIFIYKDFEKLSIIDKLFINKEGFLKFLLNSIKRVREKGGE